MTPVSRALAPNRRAQREHCFGPEGRVTAPIEGVALEPARFLHVFAADRYSDVVYDTPAETGHVD